MLESEKKTLLAHGRWDWGIFFINEVALATMNDCFPHRESYGKS